MTTTVEQQLGLGRFLANAQVASRGTSDDAYTPDWVLSLAAKALGGIIDLDPCADPQRRVQLVGTSPSQTTGYLNPGMAPSG